MKPVDYLFSIQFMQASSVRFAFLHKLSIILVSEQEIDFSFESITKI